MSSIFPNTSKDEEYPSPIIGEYAYFDNRMIKNHCHFIVTTENESSCGCHYSLSYKKEEEPYVTCHGIITSIPVIHK